MASLQTLERRILALEARLAEVEGGYGDTLYKLHRASVKTDLRMSKLMSHFDVADVSDEETSQTSPMRTSTTHSTRSELVRFS